MKILCVSDHIDPLVYSDSLKDRFAGIDLILSAGDLPADYLNFIASSLNKPLLFVLGNHYSGGMPAGKLTHAGSDVRSAGGLIVAGLDGSVRYNRGPNQYTEFQMYFKIIKLIPKMLYYRIFHGRFVDILLTHAPIRDDAPPGSDKPGTRRRGFKAFILFIKVFKPKYMVHGHIHLYDVSTARRTRCMETEVINAYNHYMIETKEG